MNKTIELNGKKWPVDFGAATFYEACELYRDCTLLEFWEALMAEKPKALQYLFCEAIRSGVEQSNSKIELPDNFNWKTVANWIGFDSDKTASLIAMAVKTLTPQIEELKGGKGDKGKKPTASTGTS